MLTFFYPFSLSHIPKKTRENSKPFHSGNEYLVRFNVKKLLAHAEKHQNFDTASKNSSVTTEYILSLFIVVMNI